MTPTTGAGGDGLTIGQLAERTGVSQSTLRIWEERHAFPTPKRLPSGHRRYSPVDVEAVRQVVGERERGVSLSAAVARVVAARERPSRSIFAGVRHGTPGLEPRLFDTRSMLCLSRAIEDECLAQGERPLLIGSFQEERTYRRSEERWRRLAAGAKLTVAFADFPSPRDDGTGPFELPIERADPLAREWAVVCRGETFGVALSGWERPREESGPGGRAFEAVWSVRPDFVDGACRVAAELAERSSPTAAERIARELEGGPRHAAELDGVVSLTNRMLAYVTSSERPTA